MPLVERLFDNIEKEFGLKMHPLRKGSNCMHKYVRRSFQTPQIDLIDEGEYYLLNADLPGFDKDNLDIELLPEEIRLTGEIDTSQDKEDTTYLYKERHHNKFSRVIQFPERIRVEEVKAEMHNGILSINIPKETPSPKETPTKLNIE